MCRAAEITKQGISVLVGNSSNHAESVNKVWKRKSHNSGKPVQKQSKPCKYCAKFHELKKKKCPAYGKEYRSCGKMNRLDSVCKYSSKKPPHHKGTKKTVHNIETADYSDSDDYSVWTLHIESDTHTPNSVSKSGVHARMTVQGHEINFQQDSGATCNILPRKAIANMPTLKPTSYTLKMYNKSTIKPLGKTQLQVTNPKNGTTYGTEFIIIKEERTPLLGNHSLQTMELMNWNKENILCVKHHIPAPVTKKQLFTDYSDVFVFEGVGRLEGQYHLVFDDNAQPVVHAPRKVPVALKPLLKAEITRLQEMNIVHLLANQLRGSQVV
jgi:hypothetical protein